MRPQKKVIIFTKPECVPVHLALYFTMCATTRYILAYTTKNILWFLLVLLFSILTYTLLNSLWVTILLFSKVFFPSYYLYTCIYVYTIGWWCNAILLTKSNLNILLFWKLFVLSSMNDIFWNVFPFCNRCSNVAVDQGRTWAVQYNR